MLWLIYRSIMLTVMRSSILVGGQAVIDGVMMRVPGAYATAVRKSDGSIVYDYHKFISKASIKGSLSSLPIIRGMIHLYESMRIGYQPLDWSMNVNNPISDNNNKILDSILSLLSVYLPLVFFLGPQF